MPAALSFQSVSKRYAPLRGGAPAFVALDEVSFDVAEGGILGLLGPNGAGKTTLISILAGLARASSGRALVLGVDAQREPLRLQSGYFGIRRNEAWIDELLAHLGLADKADAQPRHLSGGMKRRLMVAQALVHRPPVIVLDEPTAGVDVDLRQSLWQFIARLNREGHTIMLTTHYLEEAQALAGRIAMLRKGRLVALDDTAALLASTRASQLSFTVAGAAGDAGQAGVLERLPAALLPQARVTGRVVQLSVQSADDVEQALAAVRQAGLLAENVEVRHADLEDVFLNVMAAR